MLDGGEVVGVHEGAGAEVFHEGDVVVFGELEEVFQFGFAGEAAEVEVRAMDFQNEGGALGDRFFVIVEMGFVGGADFDEFGAGGFEDVGDAEAAADFDELAAGDDDFGFAFGDEGTKGEDEGGGAVVDHGGGFGFDEDGEGFFEEGSAFATLAGGEVDLEVAVIGGDVVDGLGGAVTEGGTAEIGVDEDAGAVEDGLEAGTFEDLEGGGDAGGDVVAGEFFSGLETFAVGGEVALDEADDEGLGELGVFGELLREFFHGGKGGQIHEETMPEGWEKSTSDDDKASARFLLNSMGNSGYWVWLSKCNQ